MTLIATLFRLNMPSLCANLAHDRQTQSSKKKMTEFMLLTEFCLKDVCVQFS